jgi:Cu(I)/Ag(I) efflux system membrane protein CusA/SilA
MVPMAIPSFGGMLVVLVSVFVVPVLYCAIEEMKFLLRLRHNGGAEEEVSQDSMSGGNVGG